jgi:hypothetical protein
MRKARVQSSDIPAAWAAIASSAAWRVPCRLVLPRGLQGQSDGRLERVQIADLDDVRDLGPARKPDRSATATHLKQPTIAQPSLDAGARDDPNTGAVDERELAQVKHDLA